MTWSDDQVQVPHLSEQSAQRPADSDWEVPGFSMVCLPQIHMLGSWWRISVLEDGVQQIPEMESNKRCLGHWTLKECLWKGLRYVSWDF